jgi:hypothetical protein
VGGLGSFGINPKDWLKNPRIAGHDTIDGTDTTHVAAGIDIPKLLADLNKLLQRTSSSTGSTAVPTISPSSQAKIAARVQNPTVDVWTGSSDKMLRKLSVALTVPITGTTSTELGGVTSAAISLTLQYTSLNQPQTIKAPAGTRPYTEFQQKIRAAVTSLLGITVGAGGAGTSGAGGASGTAGASSTNAPSASGVTAYGQCIQSAGGDVSKMQQCAGLLNGH